MESELNLLTLDVGSASKKTSFYYSFSLLPKEQRNAIKTIYNFCRVTDDIVDNASDMKVKGEWLHRWRIELENALEGHSSFAILNQLITVAKRFNIPVVHFFELIKGVEMDLTKKRYETFEELREYCYLVASSVGQMCLGIFGSKNERNRDYAVNLGIALQLTNVIRDVEIDLRYGRIYLPLEDLRRFNYTEEDLRYKRYTPSFIRLMEFEADRADQFFKKAQENFVQEDRGIMFPAKIMERIYYHTLQRIRQANYNVFDRSITLPRYLQFLIAMKYWIRDRLFG